MVFTFGRPPPAGQQDVGGIYSCGSRPSVEDVPQCTVYLLTVVGADFSFWQLRSKLVYTLVKVFVWMCIFIFLSDYPDTEYLVQRTGICPV